MCNCYGLLGYNAYFYDVYFKVVHSACVWQVTAFHRLSTAQAKGPELVFWKC